MNKRLEQIDIAIEKYAAQMDDKTVVFDEIYDWISDYLKDPDLDSEQLELALLSSHWFFDEEDDIEYDMYYIHRKKFFKGKQFLIAPAQWEIDAGILVPGHRFFGVLNPSICSVSVSLFVNETPVSTKKTSLPLPQVMTTLVFFGAAKGTEYLIIDDDSNKDVLSCILDDSAPKQSEALVTVFDLKDLYDKNKIKVGDSLLLTIEDWETGKYNIESVVAAKEITKKFIKRWKNGLKSSLISVFDMCGTDIDADNQLAQAYFHSDNSNEFDLMKNPALPFSAFFNTEQKDWLSLQEFCGTTIFWHKEQDVREDIMMQGIYDAGNIYNDTGNEIDDILKQIGLSFSKDEIIAYMFDALSRQEESSATVEEILFKGRLVHPEDKKHLLSLVKNLWTEVKSEYYTSCDPHIRNRRKILKINDSIIACLRELDANNLDPEELIHNEAFLHLNETSAIVFQMITMFNNLKDPIPEDKLLHIDKLETAVTELINVVREEFLSNNNPNILQFPKKSEDKIYQLKISLKYTKPPIWRRILIPANMKLEDLHEAIQCVMGWYNCHLHHFIDGNTFFKPAPHPEEVPFFMNEFDDVDYSNIKICDLLIHEKQKIEYEYDFGDSWIHTITLEKIVDRDKNITYPVCIKGKRACPPEDCGGIPGFYSILEDSDFMDKEARDHYMEEIGDPELFDIKSINDRLQLNLG